MELHDQTAKLHGSVAVIFESVLTFGYMGRDFPWAGLPPARQSTITVALTPAQAGAQAGISWGPACNVNVRKTQANFSERTRAETCLGARLRGQDD